MDLFLATFEVCRGSPRHSHEVYPCQFNSPPVRQVCNTSTTYRNRSESAQEAASATREESQHTVGVIDTSNVQGTIVCHGATDVMAAGTAQGEQMNHLVTEFPVLGSSSV